jgi:hypothetical protein
MLIMVLMAYSLVMRSEQFNKWAHQANMSSMVGSIQRRS